MFKAHVPIICQACLIFQFHSTVFPTQEITRYALPLSCKCKGWKLKNSLQYRFAGSGKQSAVILLGSLWCCLEIIHLMVQRSLFFIFGSGINISLFRWLVNSNYMWPTPRQDPACTCSYPVIPLKTQTWKPLKQDSVWGRQPNPIGSMYGTFTYIWLIFMM